MDKIQLKPTIETVDNDMTEQDMKMPYFKASSILYITGALFLFIGTSLPLVEILSRPRDNMPDTFIELLEWNPFSEMGLVGITVGIFLFWLGIMVDRRGA